MNTDKRALRQATGICCTLAAIHLMTGCATGQHARPTDAQLTPRDVVQLRITMAESLVQRRDYDRALPYLKDLLARDPTRSPRVRLMLGIVLREKGMYRAAATELRKVLKQRPRSARAQAAYGVLLDKMSRHSAAEKHHRRAVALDADNGRYHNDLGFCLFLQRRLDDAKKVMREAIRLDPSLRRAFNNLGFIYGLEGDRQTALKTFKQAGSLAMALTNMGLVEELRGHPRSARRYYEKALRFEPNYGPALRNLRAVQPQVGDADVPHKRGDAR